MVVTPAQSRRYAYLANNLNKEDFVAYYAHLLKGNRAEDFFDKMAKHQEHDQSTHGSWANGEGGVENGFMRLAPQFDNFEDFSRAVSLDGLRPRQWHIAGDDFKLDSLRKPTDRTGSTTQEAGLFVGEPKIWEDYAVGREEVVEYDLSGLTYTSKPFSDTKADFFSDQSGNQGFFIRPSGFAKLKEVGRFSISEAKQRADKQSKQMLKSKEEARILWERAKEKLVQKNESHDQSTHGSWANGGTSPSLQNDYDKQYKNAGGEIENQAKILDNYIRQGYKTYNGYLRGVRVEEIYAPNENTKTHIKYLDELIDKAPISFGNTTLYRVFSNNVLSSLKEGDIVTDKGFLSTTRKDISSVDETYSRILLGEISPSMDTVGVILPNKSKNGKGISVDTFKRSRDTEQLTSTQEREVILPRSTPLKFIGYKQLPFISETAANLNQDTHVAVFERMDG
jgi:hypothetical protein